MPTKLVFDKEHSLVVEEDLAAVEGAFRTAAPNPAALAEFTHKGERILVNVALVRAFADKKEGSGVSFL
jgi:hypothetical protein